MAGDDDQTVTRDVHRTHGDAVHVEAVDHRADELVHRAPEILCSRVEPTHRALRLCEDEAPVGQGYADVVDGEAGLAPDGVDVDRRFQPESRCGVADGLRRPPREHLGLEHETARGTGSSGRRIRRLTGCRVRHVLDLGFHPVLNVRTATMAPHEHGVPGVSAAGALHHMAAPVPGAPTSTLDPLPPPTFRSCRTGRM